MATVNYTITTNVGETWSGTFVGVTLANPVKDPGNLATSVTADSGSFSFSPYEFELYPAGPDENYVTWRDSATPGGSQYPTTGYSFDIWSDDLFAAIDASSTWNDLITTGTYDLTSSKHTLIYNYNVPYAVHAGDGGTIVFT